VRILWAKANKILPVHSGGDIRSYQILRHLAVRHQVVFVSYYDGNTDVRYEDEIKAIFPQAFLLATGRKYSAPFRRTWDYLRRLPNQAPYAVSRFASSAVQHWIRQRLAEGGIDVAVCDFLDAAVNFPAEPGVPNVLFQHNVESEIWRRHAGAESNPVKKLLYRTEFRKMLGYEQAMVRKFDHVIAVSDHDKRLMENWAARAKISIVPTGVDCQEYSVGSSAREEMPLVVFVGAMDWEPNIGAVEHFCSKLWPRVLRAVPQARFRIVGRDPGPRVKKWACDSVEITGRVRSVVDHLREAAVVVVPIQIGGGTRLKIYEAMAAGKAVVSTSVGAEGLEVHDGRDIVIADDQAGFARAVVTFLRDPEERHRFGEAAAKQAAQFDWAVAGKKFAAVLESLCSKQDRQGHKPPMSRKLEQSRLSG
jgi:glycosyltransferase involved in cell wall biosynthesis